VPATEWGYLATAEEFESWILHRDSDLLAVNKPGGLVCHPSKRGPWSSLVGAAREYLGADQLHMPSRLDRETSGVVVFALNRSTASRLQTAMSRKQAAKQYHAIVHGRMEAPVTVDQPIGAVEGALVHNRQGVVATGRSSTTRFQPLATTPRFSLVRVTPETGRLHQIRVHAAWLGHPVVGDKVYGPDERHFLEFIHHGFTPRMAEQLLLPRHALHASRIEFPGGPSLHAPWPEDLARFCRDQALAGALADRT
jgi:23S rRNA pseudouridine1911/1915/1917 synthase